ncbi:hypothetical protein ACIQCG_13305 [Streptomyces noursei]|uniref:hypothetical protein n=1 Tax=Streptomyces noursei TaxID=1971 RepID=UPI00382430D0
MKSGIAEDVQRLVKEWGKQARAEARAAGGTLPPPFSRVPKYVHEPLFREARYWHALATGAFLDEIAEPRPSVFHVKAIRRHLTNCVEHLHSMMNARGDALPEGVRGQLALIEQRAAMALDLVERAGDAWGREEEHAWGELTWWARKLHYGWTPGTPEPWDPSYTRPRPLP